MAIYRPTDAIRATHDEDRVCTIPSSSTRRPSSTNCLCAIIDVEAPSSPSSESGSIKRCRHLWKALEKCAFGGEQRPPLKRRALDLRVSSFEGGRCVVECRSGPWAPCLELDSTKAVRPCATCDCEPQRRPSPNGSSRAGGPRRRGTPKVALPPRSADGLAADALLLSHAEERLVRQRRLLRRQAAAGRARLRAQGARVPLLAARRFTINCDMLGFRRGPAGSARTGPAGAGHGAARVAEWRRLRALMSRTKRKRVEPDEPRGAGARRALRRVAGGRPRRRRGARRASASRGAWRRLRRAPTRPGWS